MSSEEMERGSWPLHELPPSWCWAAFSDVISNVTSSTAKLPKKEYLREGAFPVVDQGEGLIAGYSDSKDLLNPAPPPTIVFGDHTRAIKLMYEQFVQGADGVKVLSPDDPIDIRFVYWALNTLRLPNRGYSRHFRFLKASDLPLAPLSEQQRIVSKIEELFLELDAGIQALDRAEVRLEQCQTSVLKAAVEGKLTEQWRRESPAQESGPDLLDRILGERRVRWGKEQLAKYESRGKKPPKNWQARYKEPVWPDIGDLPDLPEGWCWATAEQITTRISDGVHKKPDYVEEGVPFITVKNLTAGPGISFQDVKYITPTAHEEYIGRTNPERGDVLISKDGTLGVVRLIDTDREFSIFVSVALFKPVLPGLGAHLALMLTTPQVQSRLVATGTGLQHLHLTDLRSTAIPIAPLQEQTALQSEVNQLMATVDAARSRIASGQVRSSRLRQSILKRAFEGRLVSQDPDDEPASVLLERIRDQREAEVPKKKRRTKKKNPQSELDL